MSTSEDFAEPLDPQLAGYLIADPSKIPPDQGDAGASKDMPGRFASYFSSLARQTSGLDASGRRIARSMTMDAAKLGLDHASSIHYTQGAQRWYGIAHKRVAAAGHYPAYADCSSFSTWCLWNPLWHHYQLRDHVNGQEWKAGYTGTLLRHGVTVHGIQHAQHADLVIYGNGWPGEHVAVYVGGGLVISHGSEGGPYLLHWNYRSDAMSIRRYI